MNDRISDQMLVDELVATLDVQPIEPDLFLGHTPEVSRSRVYGGQSLGQALTAAGRTVDDSRAIHSLHSHFIRLADPTVPIEYHVDRIRDGRSFSMRRVDARQHGKTTFTLTASFQVPEEGLEHHSPSADSPPLDPERYPDEALSWPPRPWPSFPFDVRSLGPREPADPAQSNTIYLTWMKVPVELPDVPLLHASAMAFASDMPAMSAVLRHHGVHERTDLRAASLDHAIWFHHQFRVDEWLLYQQESLSGSGGRGLGLGKIFTTDGRHVATTTQEGMMRVRR